MEWLWQLLDELQKNPIFLKLQDFAPFDWMIMLFLLFGLAYGSRQGVRNMFGKVLAISLTGLFVMAFYDDGAAFIHSNISSISITIAEPIAFLLLSIFSFLSFSWLVNILGKIVSIEITGALKPLGGICLGCFYFVLLLSLVSQFFLFFPSESIQTLFKSGQNYSGYTISQVLPKIYTFITQSENSIHGESFNKSQNNLKTYQGG